MFDRGEDGYKSIIGPRMRVEGRMYDLPALGNGSRVVAGAQWQYDDARGSQGILYAGVRLAFGGTPKLDRFQRRMVNPVVRDVDIITNTGGRGPAEQACLVFPEHDPMMCAPADHQVGDVVFINEDTADPEMVFANAGANSVVIFNGQISTATGFFFNDGQVAMGGGGILPVIGCETGLEANFRAPGRRATISGTSTMDDIFTLADHNVVSGLNLVGGRFGLSGLNGGTFLFRNISVTGAQFDGAYFEDDVFVDIVNSRFHDNGFDGFYVLGNLNGNITNSQFNDNDLRGLIVIDNLTGNITGSRFNGNGGRGLFVGDNPQHTTEVIDMAVSVYHAGDGSFAKMFVCERQCCSRGFCGGQWINDEPALLATDQCHVGDIE